MIFHIHQLNILIIIQNKLNMCNVSTFGKRPDVNSLVCLEMENKEYYNYMKKYSTKQFTAKHTFNSDDDSDKFRTLLVRHFLSTMDDLKSDYVYIPDMPYDYFDDVFAEHIDDPAVMRIEALYEVGYFYDSTGAKCKIFFY